jgi:hypothetical protein
MEPKGSVPHSQEPTLVPILSQTNPVQFVAQTTTESKACLKATSFVK